MTVDEDYALILFGDENVNAFPVAWRLIPSGHAYWGKVPWAPPVDARSGRSCLGSVRI